ncbi:hypothetical protein ABZ807_25745, partial [Micromonospora sp. NPDC047548]|uniref:hypothetical protein n=1 Tax=Micromonospora sp. NPDC047548 TaxID=3155624 RepID=UPI00340D1120
NLHLLHSTASSEIPYIDLTLRARGALKRQAEAAYRDYPSDLAIARIAPASSVEGGTWSKTRRS